MTGFLDVSAPSTAAEYARYVDGDILGKLIVRNFLINRIGVPPEAIFTPVGRYGDAVVKYANPGNVTHDPGDGHVDLPSGRLTFEIKLARINIANRSRGGAGENWAFVNLKHSPGKAAKSYQLLVAVGVSTLGLEDDRYWTHLRLLDAQLRAKGLQSRLDALPHEEEYLSRCSFFLIPRTSVKSNYFRVNLTSVDKSAYAEFLARGSDPACCRKQWASAIAACNEALYVPSDRPEK